MMRLTSRTSSTTPAPPPVEPTVEQSRFPLGSTVKISGTRGGVYVVRSYNRDGSLSLFGGAAGHAAWRAVMPDRARKISTKRGGTQ